MAGFNVSQKLENSGYDYLKEMLKSCQNLVYTNGLNNWSKWLGSMQLAGKYYNVLLNIVEIVSTFKSYPNVTMV